MQEKWSVVISLSDITLPLCLSCALFFTQLFGPYLPSIFHFKNIDFFFFFTSYKTFINKFILNHFSFNFIFKLLKH